MRARRRPSHKAERSPGPIIGWKEAGDCTATRFEWNQLVLAGDPQAENPNHRGNIKSDFLAARWPLGSCFSGDERVMR
ncbi:MAG: hypothetical protein NZ533_09900 [Casimicrobiaceae bacterium]|nr:hypothetical protein [Casimicrobiaceae bacterium]MCX8099149.1 hypothetical protein [Casimicrobiaceae bacterium]MDW8311444.1 hypothetical protein [Burkholderiales bacterium]